MRKVLVFGGAAIVLGVCLVLPVALNSQASGAQASTVVSPAASHAESQSAAVVANEPRAVAPSAKKSTATEAQAGALLLAGRRVDALALYRELARSTNSTTGIEAMAEVLSQEVPSP